MRSWSEGIRQFDYVKPVIEVLTKAASRNRPFQILLVAAIRRISISMVRVPPTCSISCSCKIAQEFRSAGRGHFADLIEKNRSAVRHFQASFLLRQSAR